MKKLDPQKIDICDESLIKTGMKVKIRDISVDEFCDIDDHFEGPGFVSREENFIYNMEMFIGEVVTIDSESQPFRIKEDGGRYWWHISFFCPLFKYGSLFTDNDMFTI